VPKCTGVAVDLALAATNPNIIGYVGAYCQLKVTGRAGIQSFGGAQLINLAPFQPFIQPIVGAARRVPVGQIGKSVSSPIRENISVSFWPKSPLYRSHPGPTPRGVSRSSRA
jgi:hypothetical protein